MATPNEKLARIIRRMTARLYPLAAKKCVINVEYIDGSKTKIPICLGESSAVVRDSRGVERDRDAKQRILNASPLKDSKPATMKRILASAELSETAWNRNKLWDLVDEGELISLRDGFRKAK